MELKPQYFFIKETPTLLKYGIHGYPHEYSDKKMLHIGGPLHNQRASTVTEGHDDYFRYERHGGGDGLPNRTIYMHKSLIENERLPDGSL